MSDHSASVKIVVFASGQFALPVISTLLQQELLAGVIVPDPSQLHTAAGEVNGLIMQLHQAGIPYEIVCKEKLPLISPLLDKWQATLGVIATYPHILPLEVIEFFSFGVFNLHGSLLPAYRGPSPLFWQIKNQEQTSGIVLHKAEATADSGNIVFSKEIPLHPLDTIQSLGNQLAAHACELVDKLTGHIKEHGECPAGTPQVALPEILKQSGRFFARRPVQSDVEINCETLTAAEINALCRASANQTFPAYIMIKRVAINVLQATAVHHPAYGTKPGTVMVVDEDEGFIVCVKGGCVRLDVVASMDGVFSGAAFAERFQIDAGLQIPASSVAL